MQVQIEIIEEEHQEKASITEEYIRSLFKRQPGEPEDDPTQREKKLNVLKKALPKTLTSHLMKAIYLF